MKRLSALLLCLFLGFDTGAQAGEVRQHRLEGVTVSVERMISGLEEPWSIGFLPDGTALITERGGRLLSFARDQVHSVSGLPAVAAFGQGGLLDIVPARDFALTRELFLSFAEPRNDGAGTALAVARFSDDGRSLENLRVIFRQKDTSARGQHFGGRVVEADDNTLFLSIGERGAADQAQNLMAHNGKIIRVARDGSLPAGNPFAQGSGLPEIWSYGHRNPQGATLDTEGVLWIVEHGAQGGDEVNRPVAGGNFGWPVISYGRNYDGSKIGVGTTLDGMEQPAFYWDPSIAPSGMMIYSGILFPGWKGDFFVGSLKFNMISRLRRDGEGVVEVERLFQGDYIRIRDIREAPDGSIWFLSVGDGAAYRIAPE